MVLDMRLISLILAIIPLAGAQDVKRPRITGVAHIALFVSDMEKARTFYKDLLGYGEPFSLNKPDGSLDLTFIKINDRQYIELFPEQAPRTDRLHHISIETDDAEAMRRYLASKGVPVPPKVNKVRIGNLAFNVKDPDGHTVEIVQYMPGSWSSREKGKFMDTPRVSIRMMHVGILVGSLDASMKFYRDILGFREFWRGSRDPKVLNWVNMRVPDGEDYVEFMLYDQLPEPTNRGSQHHLCLEVPDMNMALKVVETRTMKTRYNKPLEVRTGINRRRQLNLFDMDGTRTELMEPHTVDGKPPVSSTLPPPR